MNTSVFKLKIFDAEISSVDAIQYNDRLKITIEGNHVEFFQSVHLAGVSTKSIKIEYVRKGSCSFEFVIEDKIQDKITIHYKGQFNSIQYTIQSHDIYEVCKLLSSV